MYGQDGSRSSCGVLVVLLQRVSWMAPETIDYQGGGAVTGIRRFVSRLVLVAIISAALITLGALLLVASAGQVPDSPAPVPAQAPQGLDASAAIAPAGVITQLGVILDGSASITAAQFRAMTEGLASAIASPTFPKDGSIELTVVQYGDGLTPPTGPSRLEVGPVVITPGNVAAVIAAVQAITQAGGGAQSPMACGVYRLRDAWGPASASPQNSPTANTGTWTNPANAYTNNGVNASATHTQQHQYYGYGFAVPAGATINGIVVTLEDAYRTAGGSNCTRTGAISVELSWDGGTSWTSTGNFASLTASAADYNLGGVSNTWGRTWTAAEINQLRVRVRARAQQSGAGCSGTTSVYVDWIPVRVYYTLPTVARVVNLMTDGEPGNCCSDATTTFGGPSCNESSEYRANAQNAFATLRSDTLFQAPRDRIVVEGFGLSISDRNWLRDYIVWSQPGQVVTGTPPVFPANVGWVRPVTTSTHVREAVLAKLFLSACAMTVDLVGSPTSCCAPLTSYFTATITSGTGPYSYRWYFGDGSSASGSGAPGPTLTAQHTFDPGVFTVRLWVTDSLGCTSIVTKTNYVTSHGVWADFDVDHAESACAPLVVWFYDKADSDPGSIVGWHWDFGDGTSSDESDPVHVYYQPGTYQVTLTVTDSHGCADTVSDQITVNQCLFVDKTDQRDPVCNGWRIRYTIRVTNTDTIAHTVRVTDTLPSGTYFVACNMGCVGSYGSPKAAWSVNVPAGSAVVLQLEVGTFSTLQGLITNRVDLLCPVVLNGWGNGAPAGGFVTFDEEGTTVQVCAQPTPTPTPYPSGPGVCPRQSFADYAPHGIPDFNMQQGNWTGSGWTHAAPAAASDALWWLDSQAEAVLGSKYGLVTAYGAWGDHAPANVPPLVEDLAAQMGTGSGGTNLEDVQDGLQKYLAKQGVQPAFVVETAKGPSPAWMLRKAQREEGVFLVLLGFWQQDGGTWQRVGGHWVAACCIDPTGSGIEFGDPWFDRAAGGFPGRAFGLPPVNPTVYNDAANVSYDHYLFGPTGVPGAQWSPVNYGGADLPGLVNNSLGMNFAADLEAYRGRFNTEAPVFVAADYAVFIRPLPGYPAFTQRTVTIQKGISGNGQDTFMYRYNANTNFGADPLLKVGYKQTNAALVQFDLSGIPAGAVIDQARLEVYATGWGGADITFGAYAVLTPWVEGQATWNQAAAGSPWAAAGCNDTASDRRAVPQASVTTAGPSRWYSFDVAGLVQEWVNGSLVNNGVLLRAEFSNFAFFFASNEYADAALRPRLVVTYH